MAVSSGRVMDISKLDLVFLGTLKVKVSVFLANENCIPELKLHTKIETDCAYLTLSLVFNFLRQWRL